MSAFRISLEKAGKRYLREWIFRGVELSLSSGDRIAVMGPKQLGGVLSIVARQRTEAAGQEFDEAAFVPRLFARAVDVNQEVRHGDDARAVRGTRRSQVERGGVFANHGRWQGDGGDRDLRHHDSGPVEAARLARRPRRDARGDGSLEPRA